MVVLTQMCVDWLLNELSGSSLSSSASTTNLTQLCDNLNILYLNSSDNVLHDCCEMQSNDQNYSDYINDYQKKHNNINNINGNQNGDNNLNNSEGNRKNKQRSPESVSSNSRFKSFKITDQELNAIGMATPIKLKVLHDNEIICTYQLNENSFITICTLTGKLVTLSVHILPLNSQYSHNQYTSEEESEMMAVSKANLESIVENQNVHMKQLSVDGSTVGVDSIENHNGTINPLMLCSTISNTSCDFERLPKMQTPRSGHGCITYKNKLYIIGGYDRGDCLNLCELYNPIENKLEEVRTMHCRRGRAAVTWYEKDKSIYVIGGSDGHEDLNSLEYFNIEKNEWTMIKFDYELACTNLGAIACENYIYLVGLKNEKSSARTICLKYEPQTQKFIRLANLNNGRSQSALVWLSTENLEYYLYVFGGYDQYRCLNSCEIYNIKEDKWSVLPAMHEPRRGCGAAYHEPTQCIYIVGGTNGSSSLRNTEIFDIKNKKWIAGPELNIARNNVSIAFIGKF